MVLDQYELRFISEPSRVRFAVRSLLDFIDIQGPTSEVRDDLKLIFSELLYNAVIHGNKEDRAKSVYVKVETGAEHLVAIIRDEGSGFDYNHVIEYAKTTEALLNQHGRGMMLVCALTDNLSFNEAGNCIRFEKRLK